MYRHTALGFCLLLSVACGPAEDGDSTSTATPTSDVETGRQILVLSTDYSTGTYGTLDLNSLVVQSSIGVIHSDAVGLVHDETAYIINRLGADNIQILTDSFATQSQFSVGNGTNPYDMAFVSNTEAYVALFGANYLPVFDVTTGEMSSQVDLSALADSDGLPEVAGVKVMGDHAFVSLQRLDQNGGWVAVPPSYIAVVDAISDTLVDVDEVAEGIQGIELTYANPVGGLKLLPDGRLVTLSVGDYFTTGDGGIEIIDPAPPYNREIVVTEAEYGGSATYFTTADGVNYFIVVNVPAESGVSTHLVQYNTDTQAVTTLFETAGYSIGDIAITGENELIVCDRTYEQPGIRIFNAETGAQITTDPIDIGLPPSSLIVFDEASEGL